MQRNGSQINENEVVQKFVYDEESYEVESQELIRFYLITEFFLT